MLACRMFSVVGMSSPLHPSLWKFFFNYSLLCLTVLELCCCAWAFSGCGEQGLLSRCGAQASHCSGFSCCGAWAFSSCGSQTRACRLECTGLAASRHVGSYQTGDRTHVPCIGRQILNHWTTGDVSLWNFYNSFIEIKFPWCTIHPFKWYNSVAFCIFAESCIHYHTFRAFSVPTPQRNLTHTAITSQCFHYRPLLAIGNHSSTFCF